MEKKKRLHRPSRIIISIVWKIFERFSTKSRLKFFPIPSKKEKKKIKNSHRTRHLPITDFGDRFTHEIAPIERDPVQNHCAQFTAANSAPERSSLETTTRRFRPTGWFPDSRDFIPRVKAHYSCNPIFIRDTAVCRNHGKSLSRRTYRAKSCVYICVCSLCVSVCVCVRWLVGREAIGNQGARSNYRRIMDG